jgi:hypothetical protein
MTINFDLTGEYHALDGSWPDLDILFNFDPATNTFGHVDMYSNLDTSVDQGLISMSGVVGNVEFSGSVALPVTQTDQTQMGYAQGMEVPHADPVSAADVSVPEPGMWVLLLAPLAYWLCSGVVKWRRHA